MTTPKAVLNALARNVKDLVACKDLLVVKPLGHVLRALTFERTSYKGKYYLWRVVMPLYRQRHILSLNYSIRIGSGEYFFELGSQSLEEAVHEVQATIDASNSFDVLRGIKSPREFLDLVNYIDVDTDSDRRRLMDVAFSHWLIGSHAECERILRRSTTIPIAHEYETELASEITAVLEEIQHSPSSVSTRLVAWEDCNKLQLLGENGVKGLNDNTNPIP
jgi:hypothetical protein